MPDIFRDDFENGKTPYTTPFNIPLLNGSSTVVQSAPTGMPALGSSCLQIDTLAVESVTYPGKPEFATQMVAVNTPLSEDVYISARVLLPNVGNMQPNDRFWFIIASSGMVGYIVRVGVRRESTDAPKWCMWCRGITTHRYGATIVTPSPNVVRIVVHYQASTGLYELFINDNLTPEISVTAPEATPALVEQVAFGIDKTGAVGVAYDPTGIYATRTFMDALVVATEYPDDLVQRLPKITVTVMIDNVEVIGVPVTLDGSTVKYTPDAVFDVPAGNHSVEVPPDISL